MTDSRSALLRWLKPAIGVALAAVLLVTPLSGAEAAPLDESSAPIKPASAEPAAAPADATVRPGDLTITDPRTAPRPRTNGKTKSKASTQSSTSSSAAAGVDGPRISFGCSGDGTSGKRVQVMYVTPAGSPDRYPSQAALVRSELLDVDTIFSESAQKNGGSSRQVRWVHDAGCEPIIQRVSVRATTDAKGTVHRVDGSPDDTITTLAAAGYRMDDLNRKYLLFVDYTAKPNNWDDPICGVTNGMSYDSSPGLGNHNNEGRTVSRVDTQCWAGVSDDYVLPVASVVAHELTHALGAVLPGAPHSTPSGHCSDNGDLMCYALPTGYDASGYPTGYDAQMRSVCPAEQETLLDCNGDDYLNTSTAPWVSGQWLSPASAAPNAGHWNVANSSFLFTPANPSVTLRAGAAFDPGVPVPLDATLSVPSGQGWHIDYSIIQAIGTAAGGPSPAGPASCSLTRKSAVSGEAGASSTSLLCNVATTSATVRATVTSEDGLTGSVVLKLTPSGSSLRYATTTLSASANPARVGSLVTLSAKMTDNQSGQPVFGHTVHFVFRTALGGDSQIADALTDSTGTAKVTVTADTSRTYAAVTDWTNAWMNTDAALDVSTFAAPADIETVLTLSGVSSWVDPGTEATLTGRLSSAPAQPLSGQQVELWRYTSGTWSRLGVLTSDTTGTVSSKVTVTANVIYQLRYAGTVGSAGISGYAPAQSPTAVVSVRVATTTQAIIDRSAVSGGTPITASATLTQASASGASGPVAAATLELWRRDAGTWSKVSSAPTDASGQVSFATTPASSATYQIRFPGAERLQSSVSSELSFTVQVPITVTATAPASYPYDGTFLMSTLVGSAQGPVAGVEVQLWKLSSTGYVLFGTSRPSKADGTTGFLISANGTYTYQLRVASNESHGAAVSDAVTTVGVRSTVLTGSLAHTEVRYGQPVTADVKLVSTSEGAAGPLAGAVVELWAAPANGPSTRVAMATTSAAGTAAFSVPATATATYQAVFNGIADADAAETDLGKVTVERPTTATLTLASTATYGAATTASGTLTLLGTDTAVPAAPVELWTASSANETWTKIDTGTTDTSGKVSFTLRPTAGAFYQLRDAAASASSTPSAVRQLSVLRPTEALLSGPARATVGAKVTLTGTLRWAGDTTGVPSQPVELWASTPGATWVKIATATTGTSGKSTFSVMASTNAAYQLRYASRTVDSVTATASTSTTTSLAAVQATASTVAVSTTKLTFGATVKVTGTLRWDGTKTGLAGQPIELWGYAADRWDKIATAPSTSTGTVSFTVRPSFTTKYQLRYAERVVGEVTGSASSSSSATVKVTAKVKLSTPTKVKKGAATTVTGSVSPALAERTVFVVANKKVVAKATTDSSGAFSVEVKYAKSKSSVHAKVDTTSYNEGASSSTYKVTAS